MDSIQYIDILKEVLLPSARKIFNGDPFFFQQDGVSLHTSKLTSAELQDMMADGNFLPFTLPSHSTDLSPIENLWSSLDDEMKGRNCRNEDEL